MKWRGIHSLASSLCFFTLVVCIWCTPSICYASEDEEKTADAVRELMKAGDYQGALALLEPYTDQPMEHPTFFSDYLVTLVWVGRYVDAIEIFEALPSSFPRRVYLLRNMATAYREEKNFLKSADLYKAVLEQDPSDRGAMQGIVSSLTDAGDLSSASHYVERFLGENPDSAPLALAKARLLWFLSQYRDAMKLYRDIAARKDVDSEQVFRIRDDLINVLSGEQRLLLTHLMSATEGDTGDVFDYLAVLVLNKDFATAVTVFESAGLDEGVYSNNLLSKVAWAYFKIGKIERADSLYNLVLEKNPDYLPAKIGLAYCLSADGKGGKALEILDRLPLQEQKNIEVGFARAFVFEKLAQFWNAVREYDRLLVLVPKNETAIRLRLRALADLGASSLALEMAYHELPDQTDLQEDFLNDSAVDRLKWGEPHAAEEILKPLLKDRKNLRVRLDYIVALTENMDMKDAAAAYEDLLQDGISPPSWVLDSAAEAYLYLERPDKALELYNKALILDPSSVNSRRGKFYTLQELRRWREAEEVLDSLDKEQPYTGNAASPNLLKLDIAIDRGWFFADGEDYREAEKFLVDLRDKAPANTEIRNVLAHVHLWRGWPRKALNEFNIISTLDPDYKGALTGKAAALNTLAYKEEARELTSDLLSAYPQDRQVQKLARELSIETFREVVTDFFFTRDSDGYEEIKTEMTFSQPLSLYSTLYAWFLWEQSSGNGLIQRFERTGLGLRHVFNSSWTLNQKFSINYNDGNDFGSFTALRFTPDDAWSFDLSYDSFSTDVPLRARVFGIESDKIAADIVYRQSEWRSLGLFLTDMNFSDGNRRQGALLNYQQGLLSKNDWKIRVSFDLGVTRDSLQDAPYFNPSHDFTLSITPMIEQIICRIYGRSFVHRLFFGAGVYAEDGYKTKPITSLKYQQEYDFSDTQSVLWGVSLAQNVYDGRSVGSWTLYSTYRGRF